MKTIRKRGADMTQALLYAAFAIIVLISVLAMYQVVTLSNNKTTASRVMTMATMEARSLFKNAGPIPNNQYGLLLVQSGAVPSDAANADGTIKLPYGGTVSVGVGIGGRFGTFYNYSVSFSEASRNAKALCTYLSSGPSGQIIDSGPLGTNYTISGGEMGMCTEGEMGFSAQFSQ